MVKIEKTQVVGWEHAIRGMRNPMESWDKSDSNFELGCYCACEGMDCDGCDLIQDCECLGYDDRELMAKLDKAGSDHRKYMRMLVVYMDITGPLYWWKEFDTYKVGTVANSCSTMHKLTSRPITIDDFSFDDVNIPNDYAVASTTEMFMRIVTACENLRREYIRTKDKRYWRALIQMLPESYMQKRTIMLNYEVLRNMYHARKNHKLTEWSVDFCKWVESLPYSWLITMED